MFFSTLLPLALAAGAAQATYAGFNYGSTFTDNSAKQYQDFVNEFNTAKQLQGAPVTFNSARLYTMVQAGTTSDTISAIQAASDTQTSLLLGTWCSGGDAQFANEMTALKAAIAKFPNLASQIAGISVGSEDLYRISPIGIENKSGVGAGPDVITNYINQVKAALQNTAWSNIPVGHTDTWTAWVNGSNNAVIEACDFLGVDAYPYFQNTMSNSIDSAQSLFNQAMSNTQGASQGKQVWITETGWPETGPVSNLAQPSVENAKTYWDQVGCPNFGKVNTWWYTLQDAAPTAPSPSFGLVGNPLTTTPIYDLSCTNVSTSSSSSSSADPPASTGSSTATAGGAVSTPPYSNGTATGSSGSASSTGSSGSGSGSSGSSGAGSGSGSGTSSGSGSSGSSTPLQGSGSSTLKGSVAGILGAVAGAVMLL